MAGMGSSNFWSRSRCEMARRRTGTGRSAERLVIRIELPERVDEALFEPGHGGKACARASLHPVVHERGDRKVVGRDAKVLERREGMANEPSARGRTKRLRKSVEIPSSGSALRSAFTIPRHGARKSGRRRWVRTASLK